MIVSVNTIQAEGVSDFFSKSREKGNKCIRKVGNKCFKKILEELLKLEQTLVLHLHLETLKQLCHHCLK